MGPPEHWPLSHPPWDMKMLLSQVMVAHRFSTWKEPANVKILLIIGFGGMLLTHLCWDGGCGGGVERKDTAFT